MRKDRLKVILNVQVEPKKPCEMVIIKTRSLKPGTCAPLLLALGVKTLYLLKSCIFPAKCC